MKKIAPSSVSETVFNRSDKEPNPFILALMLTSLLYFTVGQQLRQKTASVPQASEQTQVAKSFIKNAETEMDLISTNLAVPAMSFGETQLTSWGDRCVAPINLDNFSAEDLNARELQKHHQKKENPGNLLGDLEHTFTLPNSLAITH